VVSNGALAIFRNVGLDDAATSMQTSSVNEPSVANNGRQIYMTGNWFASKSLDNGATWEYVSPYTTLPSAAGGFCCDQLTIYDRSRDLFIWLLQYIRGSDGTNVFRLAVKRGASLNNNSWYWWDFSPPGVNRDWTGLWFDYPDMALSTNHLWVTFNAFSGSSWRRAVVFKFPLDTLASGASLGYGWWSTTDNGSLRLTQGAGDTMYWGSHTSTSQLRLFRWEDGGNNISFWNIGVNAWSAGGYTANGPDGRNWLGRCDSRITAAWVGKGTIGFMWTANARGSRPFPHIRAVRINEASKAVVDQPDIWSSATAWAYPAAGVNDRGDVGHSLFYGGGSLHPTHCIGIRDDYSSLSLAATRASTHGPQAGAWGDYLTCSRHSPDGLTWIASGFTLQGGSERRHVEPRYVHFGRRRDERAVQRWILA
jgi:hypothetical protein